jgi:cysteine desulfurase
MRTAVGSIYLDYQATTPVDPRVVEAMSPYWEIEFGNPHSSKHAFGWRADDAVQRARQSIAELLGADADEIVFTSGATEANNLAILGLLGHRNVDRKRVIVSAIEHKCVLESARQLSRLGYQVVQAPVGRSGLVDLETLAELIDDNTELVSIMAVNNEIGTIQPIEKISTLCRKAGILLHCDAAQAGAAFEIDVVRLGVDMLSLSGHKLYGPKGIGSLYVSHAVRHQLRPIIHGGGQEGGLRSGTLPVPLCVGFGTAADILRDRLPFEQSSLQGKREAFLQALEANGVDFTVNGEGERRHPGNLNLRLRGVDAEILTANLQPNVAISTGAACTSGIPEPSHVLRAIGLTAEEAGECVRIGFGRFTTEDQSREGARLLAEMARSLMA